MKVIVEYRGTGMVKTIDTKNKVVVNKPTIRLLTDYQCSINRGPVTERVYPWNCTDWRSWKVRAKHARKNWMRHLHRIANTGGSRILNELGRCFFS